MRRDRIGDVYASASRGVHRPVNRPRWAVVASLVSMFGVVTRWPVRRRAVGVVVATLSVVVLAQTAGCATAAPAMTPEQVIGEFADATAVGNDLFPTVTGDRDATIKGSLTSPQVMSLLEGPWACGRRPLVGGPLHLTDPGCPVPAPVTAAAHGQLVSVRLPVVRHADGGLELVPLYVAGKPASMAPELNPHPGRGTLIDADGNTFTSLDDFQRRNDILGRDDQVLIAQDPTVVTETAVKVDTTTAAPFPFPAGTDPRVGLPTGYVTIPLPGEPVVVVSGSTAPSPWRYIGWGAGILAVIVVVVGMIVFAARTPRTD